MNSLEGLLGLKVKATTILDTAIVGKVYSIDQQTNTVTIDTEDGNYRVVKSTFLKGIQAQEKKRGNTNTNARQAFAQAEPKIGPVSINALKKRDADAYKAARKELASKGVGVSEEAQAIFDSLSKTLPCRWVGKSILVFDDVTVDPPYTPEACSSQADKQSAIDLVKKVVAGAQEKVGRHTKGG